MAVQTTYPGVYIDESAPGAPIQGVGTSTAAFGVAARGEISEATKITSWDQFQSEYGEHPCPATRSGTLSAGFENAARCAASCASATVATDGSTSRRRAWRWWCSACVPSPGARSGCRRRSTHHLLQNARHAVLPTHRQPGWPRHGNAQEITLGPDLAHVAPDVAARFRPGDTHHTPRRPDAGTS